MNDEAQHQIDLDMERMAMTDADGMDHPYASEWERGIRDSSDYIEMRSRVTTKRNQLQAEVEKHMTKMEAAKRHLEALENIPDEDPFTDGTVLVVKWKTYTYAALRMRSFWYTTGRQNGGAVSGLYRVPWARFADWLVEGGVQELVEMAETNRLSLVSRAVSPLPERACAIGNTHEPHVWYRSSGGRTILADEQAMCPGVSLVDTVTVTPPIYDDLAPSLPAPGLSDDEKIRNLAEKVALWRSVAANPLHGIGGHSAAPSHTCALREPHRGHLWPGPTGALVTCLGQKEEPPEERLTFTRI